MIGENGGIPIGTESARITRSIRYQERGATEVPYEVNECISYFVEMIEIYTKEQ
jgi:hypothetical protein